MRVSTSTKASMLACGSCRPRIHTTSIRDGSTVSGQPPRPEEPEQPKMGLFQTPARRANHGGEPRRGAAVASSIDPLLHSIPNVLICVSCESRLTVQPALLEAHYLVVEHAQPRSGTRAEFLRSGVGQPFGHPRGGARDLRAGPKTTARRRPICGGRLCCRSHSLSCFALCWGGPALALDVLAHPGRLSGRSATRASVLPGARRSPARSRSNLVRTVAGCHRVGPVWDWAGDACRIPSLAASMGSALKQTTSSMRCFLAIGHHVNIDVTR